VSLRGMWAYYGMWAYMVTEMVTEGDFKDAEKIFPPLFSKKKGGGE
jgi:hypothetical protein